MNTYKKPENIHKLFNPGEVFHDVNNIQSKIRARKRAKRSRKRISSQMTQDSFIFEEFGGAQDSYQSTNSNNYNDIVINCYKLINLVKLIIEIRLLVLCVNVVFITLVINPITCNWYVFFND